MLSVSARVRSDQAGPRIQNLSETRHFSGEYRTASIGTCRVRCSNFPYRPQYDLGVSHAE